MTPPIPHRDTVNGGGHVATAARDRLDGASPAEAIWHLFGAASPLLHLAELPMPGPIDPADFDQARP